jgi:hypothetical protein
MIPRKSPACLALDRGLLQQNLPKADIRITARFAYSITSSARAMSFGGTVRPSPLRF